MPYYSSPGFHDLITPWNKTYKWCVCVCYVCSLGNSRVNAKRNGFSCSRGMPTNDSQRNTSRPAFSVCFTVEFEHTFLFRNLYEGRADLELLPSQEDGGLCVSVYVWGFRDVTERKREVPGNVWDFFRGEGDYGRVVQGVFKRSGK